MTIKVTNLNSNADANTTAIYIWFRFYQQILEHNNKLQVF